MVRIYVGRNSETRRRRYIGKFIHGGLRSALAHLNRMLAERDLGRNIISSRQTVGQYDLRHTAVTLGFAAGVPPKVISEQFGHASVGFTLEVYSHVLPHVQDEAAMKVESLLMNK